MFVSCVSRCALRAGVLCMVVSLLLVAYSKVTRLYNLVILTCLSASTTTPPQPLQEQHLQVEYSSELQIRDENKWETRDVLRSMRERGVGGRHETFAAALGR